MGTKEIVGFTRILLARVHKVLVVHHNILCITPGYIFTFHETTENSTKGV